MGLAYACYTNHDHSKQEYQPRYELSGGYKEFIGVCREGFRVSRQGFTSTEGGCHPTGSSETGCSNPDIPLYQVRLKRSAVPYLKQMLSIVSLVKASGYGL